MHFTGSNGKWLGGARGSFAGLGSDKAAAPGMVTGGATGRDREKRVGFEIWVLSIVGFLGLEFGCYISYRVNWSMYLVLDYWEY